MRKDMASFPQMVEEKPDVESQEAIDDPFEYDEAEEKKAVWRLDIVLIPVSAYISATQENDY